MALGKRKQEQQSAWIATTELPKSPGHPFYKQLNELLAEAGFDTWLETLCAPFYAAKMGRDSIPPGVYFRMILIGYFEGISSQRGIAWRCHDSRSLAEFLGVPVQEATPDHSSLSRIHSRLPLEVPEAMFHFVLQLAAERNLLRGKTVAVDSTLLEADAAMKSIVRRDTCEDWKTHLRGLTDLDRAICDFIRWRQSFGGKGESWSYTTGRARGGMAGDVNAWWTAIDMLPEIVDRLRRVQILCQPAFEAIPRFDHKDGLIYCDPPYVHATRDKGSRDVYRVEMTDGDHTQLAELLWRCKSKVVLSGYPSPLYDSLYNGWRRVEFDIANHAAGGKSKARERECLWMNF